MKRILLIAVICVCGLTASASHYEARIVTDKGDIVVRLYNDTPLHRDNFVKLAREGYYDSLLFHRTVTKFMIQTGDPDSRHAAAGDELGHGGPGYTINAEIVPNNYHRKGALAAARESDEINPRRFSSGSQFYITVVPTAHLNGLYTVFGEVISGIEVAETISKSSTNADSRPKRDIRIKTIEIYERED